MKNILLSTFLILISLLTYSQIRFFKDSTFYKYEDALKKPNKVVRLDINKKDNFQSLNELDKFPNLRGLGFEDVENIDVKELTIYLSERGNIEELELFSCKMDSIEYHISKLDKLESLTLFEVKGVDIEKLIFELSKLKNFNELDISEANLGKIPQSIKNLEGLKKLWLSENGISELPDFVGKMPNLEILGLFGNEVSEIKINKQDFKNLKWIDLRYNKFEIFPIELFSLPKIERITIWYNEIVSIPEFDYLNTSLIELNLENNNLTSLPKSITNLRNLEILDLGSNQIDAKSIEQCYQLKKIKVLSFDDNDLLAIPNGISALSNLERLTLSHNEITELPKDFCSLQSLQQIGIGAMPNLNWKNSFNCLSSIKTLRRIGMFKMGVEKMPNGIELMQNIETFWLGQNKFNKDEKERIKLLVPNADCEFN